METDFLKVTVYLNRFSFTYKCRYPDNMEINRNFRENSQILAAVFIAPASKPKQIFLSFDASSSSVSLAESPPRDLQITAYK